jgi:2-oxoisovalerate dehydrogenase E1 component
MPRSEPLVPSAAWRELSTVEADWDQADPALLGTMLTTMQLIRSFEEKVLDLASAGLVHGPVHSSIGQEASAVGSALALRGSDQVNGSHRGHHIFLAKAIGYVAKGGLDPRADFKPEIATLMQRTMAEIMGLAQGFCKGRGGSMHLRWKESGNLGTNAIVGGGVPLAAGAAWAHKTAGSGDVTLSYFGDGAVNIGSVLEAMNLAATWSLPLCFFIENNHYAVSTKIGESSRETRLSARGAGFGLASWRVDGMDPLAVHLASVEAVQAMRSGQGATVIEADVYRYFHHSGGLPGSAFGYRPKDEEAQARARDPIARTGDQMIRRGLIDAEGVKRMAARCKALMEACAAELVEPAEGGALRIRPQLWPSPDFCDVGIRGDLSEMGNLRNAEQASYSGTLEERKFIDLVADVMHRRMAHDPRIVVMGEDIHRLKGGTNGATRGLADAFPGRVLGTPISENAFAGLAGGIAMDGRYIPVVELMYPDFLWVAADQVFNQIAKARHMFGGDDAMPLVLRTKVAMGTGYGSQHSMDPAGIFATSPGWRIVAPSTPFDYVGLMNSALRCEDPVLVIEHVDLYAAKGMGAVDDLDYYIPFGKARVARPGTELTVLTYLNMVEVCVNAADALGIDAEVIDLRSLDRAGLDWETITSSVQKTNNVLVVEQGALGTSYGTMLGDEVQRRLFDWLDQPVKRVTGAEASPSISKVLEAAACATPDGVAHAMRQVMADKGRLVA